MVMPSLQNEVAVVGDGRQDIRKLTWIEAITFRDRYIWLQPNLCVAAATLDVNVDRLGRQALVGEKVETQAALAEHDWHVCLPVWQAQLVGWVERFAKPTTIRNRD
jgi:hypothetical protein